MEQESILSETSSSVNEQLIKVVTEYKALLDAPLDDDESEEQRQDDAGVWLQSQLKKLSYTDHQLNMAFGLNF